MFISQTGSAANGFKKWSIDHPKDSDGNNESDEANPVVLADAATTAPKAPPLVKAK